VQPWLPAENADASVSTQTYAKAYRQGMYQKFRVGLAAAGSNFLTLDLELILNFFYLLKNDASR
jgi:hypothetical protein